MIFDVKTVNNLLNIDDAFKAPTKLMEIMLDDKRREELFKAFLKLDTDVSRDWFHEYFETEQAERKTKKQDFTPESIANLLTTLVHKPKAGYYYEPAAGTGGILISKWYKDTLTDPVNNSPKFSFVTYNPKMYWYHAEELSDRAIPFLIFNMAIRGMNGVAIQCDCLSREAKRAFFIRNDTESSLNFSEVIELPHLKRFSDFLDIKWID